MIKTLYGYEFVKKDFAKIQADFLIDELENLPKYEIVVNESSDHGFLTNEKISTISGIYLIYKDSELVYIGQSGTCIRNRIGRMLAGIRGTERYDENHSAAYKYVEYFGRDTKNLSFKYIPLKLEQLQQNLNFDDIENQLIEELKPLFNSEIYKDYRFQKVLKITDTLGVNGERVVAL